MYLIVTAEVGMIVQTSSLWFQNKTDTRLCYVSFYLQMSVNVSTALLADCSPKECAVDETTFLSEMLDETLICRTLCFSKKDQKSKTACWQ